MLKYGAVFVGRFNPPTIAHYAVIDKVKNYIVSHKDLNVSPMIFIIIVDGEKTGDDKTRNPLTRAERAALMSKNPSCQGCRFIAAGSSVEGFNKMRELGYEPVLVAGGPERVSTYIDMLQHYDPSYDRIAFEVKRNKINPDDATNLLQHITADDKNVISGTLARKAVIADNKDAFATITGLSGEELNKTFDTIKQRIAEYKNDIDATNEIYSVPGTQTDDVTKDSEPKPSDEK